jgi:hypothetical protein
MFFRDGLPKLRAYLISTLTNLQNDNLSHATLNETIIIEDQLKKQIFIVINS